jgi:Uncharacterized protein conserved in bacteria
MKQHVRRLDGYNGCEVERRQFLKLGAFFTLVTATSPVLGMPFLGRNRSIALKHAHTGEELQGIYWSQGRYLPAALKAFNQILRDFHTDEVFPIDPHLLDLLHALKLSVGAARPFHVISGYRSRATNEMLRKRSTGVAKRSLHMYGKAVDIQLPGLRLATLYQAALALRSGGVGYYPRSDFIHLDMGHVRTWRG